MPIDPRSTIQSAMNAMASGDTNKAEVLYQAMVSDHPGLFDTYMVGGVLSANQGNREAAIGRFQSALKIDSRNPAAHNWLSVMLRETGQSQLALEHALAANKLRPQVPEMMCNLGLCYLEAGQSSQAIDVLEKALAMRPGEALFRTSLAKAYESGGRTADALREYQKAAKQQPDALVFEKIGHLFSTLGRYDEAIRAYESALRLRPDSPQIHLLLSRAHSDLDHKNEALAHLNQAYDLAPHLGEVHIRKAQVLQVDGKFEEAEEEYREAIRVHPGDGVAYHGIVSARHITSSDRGLIDEISEALKLPNLSAEDRSHLFYALGKAYDNLGQYSEAMDAYDQANEIVWESQLRAHPFDLKRLRSEIDARIRIFSKDFFASELNGSASEVPIFIVGMPRSGTTLVEQILSCHSLVAAAGELSYWIQAEPRIASFQFNTFNGRALTSATGEYLEMVEQLSHGKNRVTDKNPANCLALGVIHAAFPRAKIIHTKRNPIDTALSIYMTPMRTPPDFSGVKENIVAFTLEYQRLMSHWKSVLPAEQYLEIDYEEIVSDGKQSAERLTKFCGLDWEDACLRPENNSRAVRTPSFWQVRQPLYTTSISRWKKYESCLGSFSKLL